MQQTYKTFPDLPPVLSTHTFPFPTPKPYFQTYLFVFNFFKHHAFLRHHTFYPFLSAPPQTAREYLSAFQTLLEGHLLHEALPDTLSTRSPGSSDHSSVLCAPSYLPRHLYDVIMYLSAGPPQSSPVLACLRQEPWHSPLSPASGHKRSCSGNLL